jgi:hypothetical protein
VRIPARLEARNEADDGRAAYAALRCCAFAVAAFLINCLGRIGAFFGNDLPPLRRGRNSEYYSIAMITMAAAYNLTINSNRTPRT